MKPGPPKTILDMPTYRRAYHKRRRLLAKARGICIECNSDPEQDDLTKCAGCVAVNKLRKAA